MTTGERAIVAVKKVLTEAETYRPSNYVSWRECEYKDLSRPVAEAIDAAVKEATERLQKTVDFLDVQYGKLGDERDAILAIARELAAKCLRGNSACIACGAVAYLNRFDHNDHCPVKRLEEFR